MSNPSLADLVMGAIGGGGLSQVFNYLSRRTRDRSFIEREVQTSLNEALRSVNEQLGRTDLRLKDVERHRDDCEAELEQGRRERAELRAEINKLMGGPVADYKPRMPK